jgi:hypothetical protein
VVWTHVAPLTPVCVCVWWGGVQRYGDEVVYAALDKVGERDERAGAEGWRRGERRAAPSRPAASAVPEIDRQLACAWTLIG